MIGFPIFQREVLNYSRRARSYVAQAIFLAVLVVLLVPQWPAGGSNVSGSDIANTGLWIFEWGGYLQLLLIGLIAPAVTANAITEEKDSNTLDLLLLTGAGPFALVWGKFTARLYVLVFLLFLCVPLLFALLTLGGVAASSILIELTILFSFAVFGAALALFFSTILSRTVAALVMSYAVTGALLSFPTVLEGMGVVAGPGAAFGTRSVEAAWVNPLVALSYLFHPSTFVAHESFPSSWWVTPLVLVGGGLSLVLVAALLLPVARTIERFLNLRRVLEAFDRLSWYLLRPRAWIRALFPGGAAEVGKEGPAIPRPGLRRQNPIYWKETTVNTIGRFRYWWRVNLFILLALGGSYLLFSAQLGKIEFHKVVVAVMAGLIVILSTIIAATTVSNEREDGTLTLLATTPVDCAVYVQGKVLGIARNTVLLLCFPFLHVLIFNITGVIGWETGLYLALTIPVGVAAAIIQGIFVSLVFPTTLRAILAAVLLLAVEAFLPVVCCLPGFNLPAACWYLVQPASGLVGPAAAPGTQLMPHVVIVALVFSAGTQVGFILVIYSLIRSGFDRYIGRAA